MLQAAARIADGQLPWRDFWWNYGPGQPLLLAGLDQLFGQSLLTWRVVRVLLAGLVSVLAYALARREASEPLALGAWLAVAGAMAFPAIPSPTPAVLALALGGILLAPRSALGAGALAGVAILFRLELGLAAAIGVAIAALASAPGRDGRVAAARAAGAAALTGLLLLGPFVLAGWSRFWEEAVWFAFDEQRLQRLPLPGALPGGFDLNKALELYFPYVLLAGTALWLLASLRERPPCARWPSRRWPWRACSTCSDGSTSSTWCRWPWRFPCCWPARRSASSTSGLGWLPAC